MGRKSHAQIIRSRFLENHNIVDRYMLPGHEDDEDFNLGPCFIHKTNNSFMTRNDDDSLKTEWKFIIDYDIDSDIHYNHGFSTKNQKWYGWSHRAIYGFGIGSKVVEESIAYIPKDSKAFVEYAKSFWSDKWDGAKRTVIDVKDNIKNPDGEEMGCNITLKTEYFDKQKDKEDQYEEMFMMYPPEWGKGEWTALTLDDAKIMALDFARGAS